MNRYDASGMTAAKMQAHIDLATSNHRKFEAAIDPGAERRGTIRGTDIVWGVWPDNGPRTRLGHGLCIVKGVPTMQRIASGLPQACSITTLWFPSFEAAAAACAQDGDDHLRAA